MLITFGVQVVEPLLADMGKQNDCRLNVNKHRGANSSAFDFSPCDIPTVSQDLVRKVCVNRGKVNSEIKDSINAYVVYKDIASVEKVKRSPFDCG